MVPSDRRGVPSCTFGSADGPLGIRRRHAPRDNNKTRSAVVHDVLSHPVLAKSAADWSEADGVELMYPKLKPPMLRTAPIDLGTFSRHVDDHIGASYCHGSLCVPAMLLTIMTMAVPLDITGSPRTDVSVVHDVVIQTASLTNNVGVSLMQPKLKPLIVTDGPPYPPDIG